MNDLITPQNQLTNQTTQSDNAPLSAKLEQAQANTMTAAAIGGFLGGLAGQAYTELGGEGFTPAAGAALGSLVFGTAAFAYTMLE